jgi:hypothetical protein
MNLLITNIKSVVVTRASTGKSANVVRLDGATYVNVWPRDVAQFKQDIATGSIAVSARAQLGYAEAGITIGEATNVKLDDKGTPVVRVEFTYAGGGSSLDTLVAAKEPELVGGDAAAPASPTAE